MEGKQGQGMVKCRFHCYFSTRMRATDQKTIPTEEIVCYSQFPRGGHAASHRATWRSTRVDQQGVRGPVDKSLYCDFQGKEQARHRLDKFQFT